MTKGTTRNPKLYLLDILESIERIEEYTKNLDEIRLENDFQVQDSVLRRLEVIGEAVKHLPQELKDQSISMPWKEIAGMRDVLTHEYFGVNWSLVWRVIVDDLPTLKEEIQKLIKVLS